MHDYTYDGSFDGLLTVLLEMYERKTPPNSIQPADAAQGGFLPPLYPLPPAKKKPPVYGKDC